MEMNARKFENSNEEPNEPFYLDERVDVINNREMKVYDATITSIRGSIYIVRYTNSLRVENIHLDDNLILKQWKPGRKLRMLNRVDLRSKLDKKFYEGIVIDLKGEDALIRYEIDGNRYEEWVNKNSNDIAPVGKYTGKFNPALHSPDEINKLLYNKKYYYKGTKSQEEKFKDELLSINLKIYEIKGDGNCLYRAVCHQLYGYDHYYDRLKTFVFDYIELEKEFFGQFIDGGMDKFDDYIQMKRVEGVWGDDIELQAISEMYNRPIEIYAYNKVPLKTFHEDVKNNARKRETVSGAPIRLSYHGRAHYNSVIPLEYSEFKTSLIKSTIGEHESKTLKLTKEKINCAKSSDLASLTEKFDTMGISSNNDLSIKTDIKLEASRGIFLEKGLKSIDKLIENNYGDSQFITQNTPEEETEKDLINSVLNISKKEYDVTQKHQEEVSSNSSIQFIMDMGFTLEEAIMAFSAVGNDPDHMLQYLYSLNYK